MDGHARNAAKAHVWDPLEGAFIVYLFMWPSDRDPYLREG
jgi:hypothetical protein